jgi:hypothetical protein
MSSLSRGWNPYRQRSRVVSSVVASARTIECARCAIREELFHRYRLSSKNDDDSIVR